MSKEDQLRRVLEGGIVAVVRSPDSQQLVEVTRALADGGVSVVEITMSVSGALDVLRQVRQALGDYEAALTVLEEGLALDRTDEYRERLLQKQTEVLAQLGRRQQQVAAGYHPRAAGRLAAGWRVRPARSARSRPRSRRLRARTARSAHR